MIEILLFIFFGSIAIITSLFVVLTKNAIYSAISLIMTFFSVAAMFVMLEAYFLAVLEILVYAGAIMVLFLFVIMLLNIKQEVIIPAYLKKHRLFSGVLLIGFVSGMVTIFWGTLTIITSAVPPSDMDFGQVKVVGYTLFTKYLFPFEIASLLLFVALLGTVYISKRKLD